MGLQGRQSFEVDLPRQSAKWGAQNAQKALNHTLLKHFIRIKLKDFMFKAKNPKSPEKVEQELELVHGSPADGPCRWIYVLKLCTV